jgi:AcrR family transcriptional regulator
MTKNREIQEQRMRQYFIAATREILKGEGLRAVNVRAVSERAGYSFATLYNYFKDLNELIFICVQDFMADCEKMVEEQSSDMEPGIVRLKKRMRAFIQYFTQYPDIFELFYVERMNDIGARQGTARMIYTFTDKIMDADFQTLKENHSIDDLRAESIKLSLKNSITGLLLFYNNRLQPTDYKDFLKIADQQIDICLGI